MNELKKYPICDAGNYLVIDSKRGLLTEGIETYAEAEAFVHRYDKFKGDVVIAKARTVWDAKTMKKIIRMRNNG